MMAQWPGDECGFNAHLPRPPRDKQKGHLVFGSSLAVVVKTVLASHFGW